MEGRLRLGGVAAPPPPFGRRSSGDDRGEAMLLPTVAPALTPAPGSNVPLELALLEVEREDWALLAAVDAVVFVATRAPKDWDSSESR